MKRVYYVLDKDDRYFYLRTASYGFQDEEEIKSATNEIVCDISLDLVVGKYVAFIDESIKEENDRLLVFGTPCLMENDINELDKEEYDKEFDLSIKAFSDNDEDGIDKWNSYLNSYEQKFMNFKPLASYEDLYERIR